MIEALKIITPGVLGLGVLVFAYLLHKDGEDASMWAVFGALLIMTSCSATT